MIGISEVPILSNKKLSFFDISQYVLQHSNLDTVQFSSYKNFIENIIPKHMNKVYPKPNKSGNLPFTFTFEKWWLETSDMLTEEMCIARKESQEVVLKAVIKVTFNKSFYNTKEIMLPENSIFYTVEVTRFPYLNSKGNFIINGTPKVLISFPANADKIILTDLKNKNKEKELHFTERVGASKSSKNIYMTSEGVDIRCDGRAKLTYRKILEDLGYRDEYSLIKKITGENPIILNQLSDKSSDIKHLTNVTKNINQILEAYELYDNYERTNINLKLSLMNNAVGYPLAEPVKSKKYGELPKGHELTLEEAEQLTLEGVTNVSIIASGLEVPIQTNGFVPFDILLNQLSLPLDLIPDTMIEYSSQYLSNQPTEDKSNVSYMWVKYDLFFKLYDDVFNREDLDTMEKKLDVFKTALNVYSVDLAGNYLCKEDILGMINLYSRYTLNIVPSDDIDSLENKRILNIAEIFEEGLISAIENIRNGINNLRRDYKNHEGNSWERAIMNEYKLSFGGDTITSAANKNPLYKSLDTTNPLAQINNKRKVTSQQIDGYGGVKKESQDTRPRSVNPSFSGRLDVIETPESQSVGLVRHIAALAYLNINGELEAPFLKIDKENKCIDLSKIYYMTYEQERKFNRILSPKICKEDGIKIDYYKNQNIIHTEFIKVSTKNKVSIEPYNQIALSSLSKYDADNFKITVQRKDWFEKEDNLIYHTGHGESKQGTWEDIDLVSISGSHIFSPVSSAIPFIEFDDAARAMMGSVMSKQAISIWGREPQIIKTSMSNILALNSSGVILAPYDCEIVTVDAKGILVRDLTSDKEEYIPCLLNERTSKTTLNKSIPTVKVGDICLKGDVMADSTSTIGGELTHGANMLVGYMPQDGHNYEDAILISERLVMNDTYSSFHIEEFTMLMTSGDKHVTSLESIDNNTQYSYDNAELKALQNNANKYTEGIINVGVAVKPGDILMCKLTPKIARAGKNETKTQDKLVTIKYKENTPGIIVDVAIIEKQNLIKVKVATRLKISVGDKLTGRHGNKGVIARIVPEADMPYLKNGRRLDICLTPLGIPSRMNLGQVIEGLSGLKLQSLGVRGEVEQMSGFNIDRFRTEILNEDGSDKTQLYNPKTGKPYRFKTMVVVSYIEKLEHISSHKIHARGFGTGDCTYSVNRQPLQGKASNGGQRLGEMEMWVLQDHGCSNILKELTQYRSDDDVSRKLYRDYEAERWENPDAKLDPFDVPGNMSYAFRSITALFKGMYKNLEYYDAEGNRIDPDVSTVKIYKERGKDVVQVLDRDYYRQLQSRLEKTNGLSRNDHMSAEMDEDAIAKMIYSDSLNDIPLGVDDLGLSLGDDLFGLGLNLETPAEPTQSDVPDTFEDIEDLFASVATPTLTGMEAEILLKSTGEAEEDEVYDLMPKEDKGSTNAEKDDEDEYKDLEEELFED